MNRQHRRRRATALPAALGIGLLTLALAACGGSDDGGSETPAPSTPVASEPATPEPSESASPSASTEEPSATAGSPTATGGDIEAALRAVLGDEVQIITGQEVEELQQSSQGLAEGLTVTPEECGPDGSANATAGMPEDAEMTGGVVVETTEAGGVSSDMLSVIVFADEAAAETSMTAYREFAAECPSYTMEMSEGLSATADTTVEDVDAEGDQALAVTVATSVSMEGTELPQGAGDSLSTSVHVLDGNRLVSFAGTAAGGEQKTVAEGVELIDALRAELDG